MIKELKDFLFKGNVLDLAVAVVMGAAFNAIITSLVSDIITPVILNPVVKAANHAVALDKKEEATEEAAAPSQEELLAEIRDLLANK